MDLSGLKKGVSLHLNDIKLPKGVVAVTRGKVNPVLVSVVITGGEEATAEATAVATEEAATARAAMAQAKGAVRVAAPMATRGSSREISGLVAPPV